MVAGSLHEQTEAPIMLGGLGVVLQIDESLWHKNKVGGKNGHVVVHAAVHPDIAFL